MSNNEQDEVGREFKKPEEAIAAASDELARGQDDLARSKLLDALLRWPRDPSLVEFCFTQWQGSQDCLLQNQLVAVLSAAEPADVRLRIAHAHMLEELGQQQIALDRLKRASAERPNHKGIMYSLAALLERSGEHRQALDVLLKLGDVEAATQPHLPFRVAKLSYKLGDVDEAKRRLLELKEKWPDDERILRLLWRLYCDAADLATALSICDEYLNRDSGNTAARILKSQIFLMRKQFTDAEAFILAGQSRDKLSEAAATQLVTIYLSQNAFEVALEYLETLIVCYPENTFFAARAAEAARRLERLDDAKRLALSAIERHGRKSDYLRVLGNICTQREQWQQALQFFDEANIDEPVMHQTELGALWALVNLERIGEARKRLNEWLAKGEPAVSTFFGITRLAIRFGDEQLTDSYYQKYETALAESRIEDQLDPDSAASMAQVHAAIGKPERALAFSRRACNRTSIYDKPYGNPKTRAIIFDPGFVDPSGHHYNLNRFFYNFLTDHGYQTDIYGSAFLDVNSCELSIPIEPHFSFSPYMYEDSLRSETHIENVNRVFYHEACLRPVSPDVEVVLVHTIKMQFALGLIDWVAANIPNKRATFVFGIIEAYCADERHPLFNAAASVYKKFFEKIRKLENKDFIIAVETHQVKAFMEKQAACAGVAVDVRVYPYLAASLIEEDGSKPAQNPSGRRPRVGFLGGTRRDRGAHLLPELVLKAEKQGLEVDWSFQLDLDRLTRLMDSNGGWQTRELVNCDAVTVYEGRLTVEEYAALLNDVDAVVLPYDSRYETSGSGVFYEALWLGKTIFVPENSSMARVLDEIEAPGLRLNGQDVESLVAALEDFSRNKKEIMEKALQSGKVWRAQKSPFQQFTQHFLECVNAGSV